MNFLIAHPLTKATNNQEPAMRLKVSMITSATLALCAAVSAQSPLRPGQLPRPEHSLVSARYDTTPDGLLAAARDDNTHVIRHALRYVTENKDPVLLEEAERLMIADSGPMPGGDAHPLFVAWARLEAAKYLATFDHESGLEWLRSWGPRLQEDLDRDTVDVHLARIALDSAEFLAETMDDESLSHLLPELLKHESWSIRVHVARVMGAFHDYSSSHLETSWVKAAELAPQALRLDPPVTTYIAALNGSARKQVQTTSAIVAAFDSLADIELDIAPFNDDIIAHYPIMTTIDRNLAMRISLEQLRDTLRLLPERDDDSDS